MKNDREKIEIDTLVSRWQKRIFELKEEYKNTKCRQEQSIIAGQLIELASVIATLKFFKLPSH